MTFSIRWFAAGLAALALASCGNQTDRGMIAKAVTKTIFKKKKAEAAGATPAQLQAEVAQALARSDLPLALAVVEDRNATALLTRIEVNGAYGTWATPDRRTITLKRGLVTATLGLGNDIMSTDLSGVEALIAERSAGSGRRVMRYLNGENHTVSLVASCIVTRGGDSILSAGEINERRVTAMQEDCTAQNRRFSNSYLVDETGLAVQSRQWLSPTGGYLTLQMLR